MSKLNSGRFTGPSDNFDLQSSGASWAANSDTSQPRQEEQPSRSEKRVWKSLEPCEPMSLRNPPQIEIFPIHGLNLPTQIKQKIPKQEDFPSLGPAKAELGAPSHFRPMRSKYKGIKVRLMSYQLSSYDVVSIHVILISFIPFSRESWGRKIGRTMTSSSHPTSRRGPPSSWVSSRCAESRSNKELNPSISVDCFFVCPRI